MKTRNWINISVKQRIYWSFSVLVLLFVVNGIITIVTLNNNRQLSLNISTVIDPSLQYAEDFEDMLVQSKMYTTNWVFLRSNQEDKDALKKLQESDYPKLKSKLNLLAAKWETNQVADSLQKVFAGFEELLGIEKKMMATLNKFEDYDDPVAKFEAEEVIEDELLPRTSALKNTLGNLVFWEKQTRIKENKVLENSSSSLRILITLLALIIIGTGISLSIFMSKAILHPINKIRLIVNELGKGIICKADHNVNNDEIGDMVRSVNSLSEKLQATATFATEIGNRNFNTHFEPLSADDSLGIALVAMRDNIKLSDSKLNEAQHIAHIGSWERVVKTDSVSLSDEMFRIFEFDPASFDFKFQSIMKFIHPDDKEYVMNTSRKNLYMEPVSYECRIITGKGVIKNIFVETKITLGDYGEPEKTFGIVQDITARKKAEEKLSQKEKYNRNLFDQSPVGLALAGMDGTLEDVNDAYAKITGYTIEECKKLSYYELTPEKYSAQEAEQLKALELTGRYGPYKKEYIHKNGHLVPVILSGTILEIEGAKYIWSSVEDITETKRAEMALRESESNLQAIFENASDGFILTDLNGSIKSFNNKAKEIFLLNSGKEIMTGKSIFDCVRESMQDVYKAAIPRVFAGEDMKYDLAFERENGDIKWFYFTITRVLNSGKTEGFSITAKDITETKAAEDTLKKSEEQYRQIVETAQEGIWMIDENNYTVLVNKKMADLLEYTPGEMMGKQNYCFMDDEWKKKASEDIERRKLGMDENHDFKYITKSGKEVWTNLSTNPVFGDDGSYKGALAMVTDITQRKIDEQLLKFSEASLETKNKELIQKNKELEQFAYVASHDLQEPLRTASSFVQLVQRQYRGKLDANADKYLTYIGNASDRMQVLIKDLLDYSLIGSKKGFKKIDCNLILSNVLDDLGTAIREAHAEIKVEKLPLINGYDSEIKQLFQNLIINAIKFRKKEVAPQIHISVQKNNDCWEFAVKDNGIGIDEQYKERIFVIFQRLHTRTAYEGSGIGLSHCKKIVELHGGKIWIESVPGEGTTFHFTIQKKIGLEKPNELSIAC